MILYVIAMVGISFLCFGTKKKRGFICDYEKSFLAYELMNGRECAFGFLCNVLWYWVWVVTFGGSKTYRMALHVIGGRALNPLL